MEPDHDHDHEPQPEPGPGPAPQDRTQQEVREEAAHEPDDPITRREALETELLDEGASEEGTAIGDQMG